MKTKILLTLCGCALVSLSSQANAGTWSVNGHSYDFVSTDGWIPWADAQALAIQSGGYLATLTSDAENTWVYDHIIVPANLAENHQAWLGGYRENVGQWNWVNGETWGPYINWGPGEPNNVGSVEYGLTIHRYNNAEWNDEGAWQGGISGYVVEKCAKVPDAGSTAWFLGLAVSSLAMIRRRLS